MEPILSTQNTAVKQLKKLDSKKGRKEAGAFVAEGLRVVREIPADWEISAYFLSKSFCIERDIRPFSRRAKVIVLDDRVFQAVSDTKTPQGILAVCKIKKQNLRELLAKDRPFLVLCQGVRDPGNLGAIIRTADAAGAHGVILSKDCTEAYSKKTVRATAGSIFHIPIVENEDLDQTLSKCQGQEIVVAAAHLSGKTYPYHLDFRQACAILIGNEANGLSADVTAKADHLVKIPMAGGAESLNASIAAGILLYEVVRQRLET